MLGLPSVVVISSARNGKVQKILFQEIALKNELRMAKI